LNIDSLLNKTVFELKSYAKKNGIQLDDAKKKEDILKIISEFIPTGKEEVKEEKVLNKMAVHSTRNIHWAGLGNLKIGYNVISLKQAEVMLTHKAVRSVTTEELVSYYGK